MQNPKFQIFKDKVGVPFSPQGKEWRDYSSQQRRLYKKAKLSGGIASVKLNAPYDSRYERGKARNGHYYFVLKARNGEALGMSEMYQTQAGRDNGIAAVKRDAPNAPTEDLTVTARSY